MADDFGDYSGEKLFDWILRMGQDAGGSAAMAAADKLKAALDNARKGAGAQGREVASMEAGGCDLVTAAFELPEPDHPARQVVEAFKHDQREKLVGLCRKAGIGPSAGRSAGR